jgi:hypothetical protein
MTRFPLRDGLDVVVDAGATCVIQPVAYASGTTGDYRRRTGVVMVLTGVRHFRHWSGGGFGLNSALQSPRRLVTGARPNSRSWLFVSLLSIADIRMRKPLLNK